MPTAVGEIKGIEDNHTKVYKSKKLTIQSSEGLLFVEFRGMNRHLVSDLNIGDNVIVTCYYDGKVSKAGNAYNNNVGTSIKKISKEWK